MLTINAVKPKANITALVAGKGAPSLLAAGEMNSIGYAYIWLPWLNPAIVDTGGRVTPLEVRMGCPYLVGGTTKTCNKPDQIAERCGFWILDASAIKSSIIDHEYYEGRKFIIAPLPAESEMEQIMPPMAPGPHKSGSPHSADGLQLEPHDLSLIHISEPTRPY